MTYEGWANRPTWNVSLWLNNTEDIYFAAVEFMKDYKGKKPYLAFMEDCGLSEQMTGDRIRWVSHILNYEELNAMMWELAPEGARKVQ